jgi:hypothetical protein
VVIVPDFRSCQQSQQAHIFGNFQFSSSISTW